VGARLAAAGMSGNLAPDGDTLVGEDAIARYVRLLGGRRPIRKVLVANNGIAAVKAIRSIRRWSYENFGDELAVEFVAMATPEDVAANAEYVRMADIWTPVPGGSSNHNFSNVDLIADIADRHSCDAVWAGWGHASENPALPRKLAASNITFMGPNADSMHALGDKIASTIIAQSANVPTVAWSGQGLTVDYKTTGCVPEHIYKRACVDSAEQALRVAEDCGYPVVIKASEGGGGKGIRVVLEPAALKPAYRHVAGEIPGSPIFVMRLVKNARHLEVQIVADEYGDAVALHGRDCSIQRRHQKIIEEGPVIAAPPHVWKTLESAAIALAKEVGYVGAGTVEYLYTGDSSGGNFYFLELNPRLQVEHPVTEWISGVNLPALQLHIAMGIPLKNVPCIRRFFGVSDNFIPERHIAPAHSAPGICRSAGEGGLVDSCDHALNDPTSKVRPTLSAAASLLGSEFVEAPGASINGDIIHDGSGSLFDRDPVPPRGHVIACRVTAENPDEGFQPTSGAIQELTFRNTPNVWGYFSVGASGGVHEFADSQFGHLFAWGETRESSRRSLVLALKELSIRGDIRTTVEYLIKLLEMKDFRENKIHTAWLDSLIAEKITAEKPPTELAVLIGAVCRAQLDFRARCDVFTKCLERGQLPALDRSLVEYPVELIYEDIKYWLRVTRADVSAFRVRLADDDVQSEQSVMADVRALADGAVLVLLDGRSHVCYAREEAGGMRLTIDGKTCLFPKEYDPATLTSNVSGKLVRFLINDGDHIEQETPFAELEVMKMYLTLHAPESGIISLSKPAGSSIDAGDIVATLNLDDPTKVRRSVKFRGKLPVMGPSQAVGTKPHQHFSVARKNVELLLRGFDADRSSLNTMMKLIDDPRVAVGELHDALSSLSGRISASVQRNLEMTINSIHSRPGGGPVQNGTASPSPRDTGGVDNKDLEDETNFAHDLTAVTSAVAQIKRILLNVPAASGLLSIATNYEDGSVLARVVASLLDQYIEVERPFVRSLNSPGDVLFEMRDVKRDDLASLVEVAASHIQVKVKNEVMVKFLEVIRDPSIIKRLRDDTPHVAEVRARLHQLSQFFAPSYSEIALSARIVLADLSRPQFRHRLTTVAKLLADVSSAPSSEHVQRVQRIVGLSESMLDVLMTFMLPFETSEVSTDVRRIAAEVQILRSYRAYDVSQLNVAVDNSEYATLTATWRFRFAKPDRVLSFTGSATSLHDTMLPSGISPTPDIQPQIKSHVRGITSFDSADNLSVAPGDATSASESDTFRVGILAAFASWSDLVSRFDHVLEELTSQIEVASGLDINVLTVLLRWDFTYTTVQGDLSSPGTTAMSSSADPLVFEQQVSSTLEEFCKAKPARRSIAIGAGVKSITFIVAPATPAGQSAIYPSFFTFRVRDNFQEDPIFRHIDPPMAYQLELARLSNFDITRFSYPTRSIHVFFAQDMLACRRKGDSTGGKRSTKVLAEKDVSSKDPSSFDPSSSQKQKSADLGTTIKPVASLQPALSSASGNLPPTSPAIRVINPKNVVDFDASTRGRKDATLTSGAERDVDARFFVRAVIRNLEVFSSANDAVVSIPEAERTFCEALDAVEMASCDRRFRRTDCNHIFLNVIPTVRIDVEDVQKICRRLFMRYAARCWLLRVFVVEVKVSTISSEGTDSAAFLPLRLLLFNPTGHVLRVESYIESTDPSTGRVHLISLSPADPGSLHNTLVSEPYQIMDRMQRKRVVAKTIETAYVYDFMQLFTKQLQSRWRQYSEDRLLGGFRRHKVPMTPMKCIELILNHERSAEGGLMLVPTNRPPGLNDIGMVAWRCTLFTPEFPGGRDIIVIANDITFLSGSFGPDEDNLFLAASQLARREGIPRVYLAANSGARIGIASEVRDRMQVHWVDPSDPSKGFNCLAVLRDDIEGIADSIRTGKILENGLVEVTSIIGAGHGLGVENLMGSGLIAGETSAAYEETFTLTYVTARSVGIGAYLVRLGQRVIQKENAAPIILTGFSALNKVLGHDVYLSNEQLGGTKIMYPNGVTHVVVPDDVQGISAVLDWLSFVPAARGQPLPTIESRDPVDREIQVAPPANGQPYDPRVNLICGEPIREQSDFLGGFFDKYSWRETLESWAKTVVVGRARLGGVPTGVIAVETRSVERVSPADPASPETHESIVVQAGQVWYPDSAAKTARSIKDLDREGLPLFIFANWRGFSGGMRDMFDEILKGGSEIVDALRTYRQPVFVYIPPGGELRGGAWVVVDTLINPEQIEMYADPTARGGVLEPEGTVDVKYRRRDLLDTMHRLDPVLRKLDEELKAGDEVIGLLVTEERRRTIYDNIYAREAEILPSYRNVATSFCDLHDTPERLIAKRAIRKVVPWREARKYFYWRLQRRLAENRVRGLCSKANPSLSSSEVTNLLRRWATADFTLEAEGEFSPDSSKNKGSVSEDGVAIADQSIFDTDDKWVFQWLEVEEDSIMRRINKLEVSRIADDIAEMCKQSPDGFLNGIEKALRLCSDATETSKLASAVQSRLEQASSQGSMNNSRSILPPYFLNRFRVGR
jgi:biotin carboxylase/acetyl-CoA carboxylase carboxyltransferase component/biotin carboxyl carrier protein